MRKPTFWFPTWSDTNQAVWLQKMARGLKFRIKKVEGLFYLWSENKGDDQLRGYREADLRLIFAYAKRWFSHEWLNYTIKFLKFQTHTNFTVNTLKFKLRCSTIV